MTELEKQLTSYLKDAHGLEQMSLQQLEAAAKTAEDPQLKQLFEHHLTETREHERLLRERLEAHGESSSKIKDATGRFAAMGKGMAAGLVSDTQGRLVRDAYVQESTEIASYELLARVADRAGDAETAQVARRILADERSTAEKLEGTWDRAAELSLRAAAG